eukprot:1825489-Pleurochrysis_carterae.AAC.27
MSIQASTSIFEIYGYLLVIGIPWTGRSAPGGGVVVALATVIRQFCSNDCCFSFRHMGYEYVYVLMSIQASTSLRCMDTCVLFVSHGRAAPLREAAWWCRWRRLFFDPQFLTH